MIRSLSIAITLTLLAQAAVAQAVARPRTGITAIPKATQFSIQPLTPAEMQARLRPAPTFLPPAQLNIPFRAVITVMNAPFSLTPAVQSVAGRGSLFIVGKILVPNPVPPGFSGQAVLRSRSAGYGLFPLIPTAEMDPRTPGYGLDPDEYGWARLQINAEAGKFYAVDCLAIVGPQPVNFRIYGTDSDSIGEMYPKNGHLIFTVRGTATNGLISIILHPHTTTRYGNIDTNIMDFWGCQITPGG